jgi:hypothetical protein
MTIDSKRTEGILRPEWQSRRIYRGSDSRGSADPSFWRRDSRGPNHRSDQTATSGVLELQRSAGAVEAWHHHGQQPVVGSRPTAFYALPILQSLQRRRHHLTHRPMGATPPKSVDEDLEGKGVNDDAFIYNIRTRK